jgi:hypothetical protein
MTLTLQSLLALAPNRENSVVVNRHLVAFTGSLEAAMVLGQLLYWTPRATLKEGWIAKRDADWVSELCLSKYAVRTAVRRLCAMGVLEMKVRRFCGAPMGHYRLAAEPLAAAWEKYLAPELFDAPAKGAARNDESAKTEMPDSTSVGIAKTELAKSPSRDCESEISINKEAKTTAEITTETTKPPQPPSPSAQGRKKRPGLDDYPDTAGFARFWQSWPAHPRKVGRKQCRRTWHRANLEPLADRIVAAVEVSKRSSDWTKDAGQFIPLPQTWLNQGRWEAAAALAQRPRPGEDQLLVPGKDWKPRRLTDEERAALHTLKEPVVKIKPVIPEGFVFSPAVQEGEAR